MGKNKFFKKTSRKKPIQKSHDWQRKELILGKSRDCVNSLFLGPILPSMGKIKFSKKLHAKGQFGGLWTDRGDWLAVGLDVAAHAGGGWVRAHASWRLGVCFALLLPWWSYDSGLVIIVRPASGPFFSLFFLGGPEAPLSSKLICTSVYAWRF